MKKVEGIVLQIDKRKVIILTPEGDYFSVPHPGGKIQAGDKIISSLPSLSWSKIMAAAVYLAAAIFLIIILSPLDRPDNVLTEPADYPYGYLVIDINPSLELIIDENQVVSYCRSLNSEGRLLLENCPEGKLLPVVLEWLLERSVSTGYLDPELEDNIVLVTLVESELVKLDPEMMTDVIDEKLLQLNVSAYMGINKADEQARKEADIEGVSLNRYLLSEVLRDQLGKDVPVELPLSEMINMLEKSPVEGIFRFIGKPAEKIPAPVRTDDLPTPPAYPTKPVDPPVHEPSIEIPGPFEDVSDPSEDIPDSLERKSDLDVDVHGPTKNRTGFPQ